MSKRPVAIDVSLATLDYHTVNQEEKEQAGRIQNSTTCIQKFLSGYDPTKFFLVAEPTGTYSDKLFELSQELGFELRVVNPSKSSSYMKALGMLEKNDANCALALYEMGCEKERFKLPIFQAQDEIMKQRKQMQMTLNTLSKQCRMLSNQIHAMEQRLRPSDKALSALKNSLEALEEQRQILEDDLQQLSDEEIKEFKKLSTSVKGVGEKTANLLMVHTNGLKYFDNKNQLPRFVGTIHEWHRSGSSINRKSGITKTGPSLLRATLYCAANSARRFNHACKALYERLRAKGKAHKVAMIAVINKLLHQIFAVVKSKTLFDNDRYLSNAK